MSELNIPMDIEKSEISSFFNAFVLQAFLMGIYIVIYIGTTYIYVARNSSKHRIVPATITIQCLSSIVYTSLQWYGMKQELVDNGATRDSVFLSFYETPPWLNFAIDITIYVVLVLADGLLIWRCFFIWDRSFRVISVSLVLLIAEIGLFLVQPVLRTIYKNGAVTPALAATFNDLVAAAYFTTFATSLITTTLIAYRIHAFSSETDSCKRRFKHILDIVVQSGAVYSLTALVTAISGVLPGGANIYDTRIIGFQNYIEALVVYVSGMSATVMVARVGLLSADTGYPSTDHFSGLQFHVATTHQADIEEGTDADHATDVDKMTFAEGEKTASEGH